MTNQTSSNAAGPAGTQDSTDDHALPAETKTSFFLLIVIISGMAVTHLFFTLMVYLSDMKLHDGIQQAISAGFLPVPNAHILPSLTRLGTAFKSALFFSLTLGLVWPLLVYFAAYAWEVGYRRNKKFLIVLSGFVILILVMLNWQGFNPIVSLWLLLTYFSIFKISSVRLAKAGTVLSTRRFLTHILVMVILAVMMKTIPAGTNFFITVRDHFLLSNPLGNAITDFYYRYSPYPTESVKPLKKKQLKICHIEGDTTGETLEKIETTLLRRDFLPVPDEKSVHVTIHVEDNYVSFFVSDRRVLRTTVDNFLSDPSSTLNRVSDRSDRNDVTRKLLAFCLMYGLPLFLYIALFSIFRFLFRLLRFRKYHFYLSAAACLSLGIFAIAIIHYTIADTIALSGIKEALGSTSPNTRTVAFEIISRKGLDPSDYLPKGFRVSSEYVPERIWWTISLANSEDTQSVKILLELLDDPHPLVACKAYNSLRLRGYRPAIRTILKKIGTSRQWYVQGYAYQALRSLGWKQSVSD